MTLFMLHAARVNPVRIIEVEKEQVERTEAVESAAKATMRAEKERYNGQNWNALTPQRKQAQRLQQEKGCRDRQQFRDSSISSGIWRAEAVNHSSSHASNRVIRHEGASQGLSIGQFWLHTHKGLARWTFLRTCIGLTRFSHIYLEPVKLAREKGREILQT